MSDPITRIKTPTSLVFSHTADPATALYLDGLSDQRLVGGRCERCSGIFVPLKSVCPTCCIGPMTALELPHTGKISTFCIIDIPFVGQVLTPPYACAHVLLDQADIPLFHLIGDCAPDRVHTGMRVEAVWNPDPNAIGHARLKYFRPCEAS